MQLIECVKYVSRRTAEVCCTMGSACSGSDVIVKVFSMLDIVLTHLHAVSFSMNHIMSVELDEKKRDFLKSQFGTLRCSRT